MDVPVIPTVGAARVSAPVATATVDDEVPLTSVVLAGACDAVFVLAVVHHVVLGWVLGGDGVRTKVAGERVAVFGLQVPTVVALAPAKYWPLPHVG